MKKKSSGRKAEKRAIKTTIKLLCLHKRLKKRQHLKYERKISRPENKGKRKKNVQRLRNEWINGSGVVVRKLSAVMLTQYPKWARTQNLCATCISSNDNENEWKIRLGRIWFFSGRFSKSSRFLLTHVAFHYFSFSFLFTMARRAFFVRATKYSRFLNATFLVSLYSRHRRDSFPFRMKTTLITCAKNFCFQSK